MSNSSTRTNQLSIFGGFLYGSSLEDTQPDPLSLLPISSDDARAPWKRASTWFWNTVNVRYRADHLQRQSKEFRQIVKRSIDERKHYSLGHQLLKLRSEELSDGFPLGMYKIQYGDTLDLFLHDFAILILSPSGEKKELQVKACQTIRQGEWVFSGSLRARLLTFGLLSIFTVKGRIHALFGSLPEAQILSFNEFQQTDGVSFKISTAQDSAPISSLLRLRASEDSKSPFTLTLTLVSWSGSKIRRHKYHQDFSRKEHHFKHLPICYRPGSEKGDPPTGGNPSGATTRDLRLEATGREQHISLL